jgi:hypothetical protein
MHHEFERERQARIEDRERIARERDQAERKRESIKRDLFALFAESDPHRRGKALEPVLNALFETYGMHVRSAFTLRGGDGEGSVEQIDGVVQIDGDLYLVEMKWWGMPVGKPEIAQHLVRVYQRSEARAIIISESGFTEPAVAESGRTTRPLGHVP